MHIPSVLSVAMPDTERMQDRQFQQMLKHEAQCVDGIPVGEGHALYAYAGSIV